MFTERERERPDPLRAPMAKLDEEGQLDNPMKEEAAIANVDVEKVQEMEGPQIYAFTIGQISNNGGGLSLLAIGMVRSTTHQSDQSADYFLRIIIWIL